MMMMKSTVFCGYDTRSVFVFQALVVGAKKFLLVNLMKFADYGCRASSISSTSVRDATVKLVITILVG